MVNKHAIGTLKTTAPDMETKEASPANKTNPTDLVKPEKSFILSNGKTQGQILGTICSLEMNDEVFS